MTTSLDQNQKGGTGKQQTSPFSTSGNSGKNSRSRANAQGSVNKGRSRFGARSGNGSANQGVVLNKKKALRVGDICTLKISALAANNIGIDEFSFPYAVFVPNAKYGSQVKAKILKIQDSSYAVAQIMEEVKQAESDVLKNVPVKAGDVLTVSITKTMESSKGSAGIIEFPNNFRLIVPFDASRFCPVSSSASEGKTVLENIKVSVTRIKSEFGFAKIELASSKSERNTESNASQTGVSNQLTFGAKFTTTLPKTSKQYGKFVVFKVNASLQTPNGQKSQSKTSGQTSHLSQKNDASTNGTILFVKLEKGVKLGDKVRIKITSCATKAFEGSKAGTQAASCAVGKILQVNPVSKTQKASLVMNSIREMISHGMHFGEKAVKCHARMKNYIWLKKASKSVASKQHGQARPLIKKGRHVINLLKTRRCLNQALNKLTKYALKGRTFLFIGTKKPAAGLVARASFFTKNSFYVNTRWLGGMLTNWKTICKSISKIRPILKEKQKMVRDILEKRQTIKNRLIKKALLLRKKSKLILSKGRELLETLKKGSASLSPSVNNQQSTSVVTRLASAQKLTALRNELITKGTEYLQKRQRLIQKRRELIYQTLLLKEKGMQISAKHNTILNQLAIYAKKLREYKYLLILTTEIKNLKASSASSSLVSVSYSKLKEVNQNSPWIIPNPPKEILNKIVLTMKNQLLDSTKTNAEENLIAGKSTSSKQMIVCSTLLSKFSRFSSYIKSVIKTLITSIKSLEAQSQNYTNELNQIKNTLKTYLSLKHKYVAELQQLKGNFAKERSVIRIVKRKLKALDAQKKLMKFLPRLRYLPTPQTKISEIVQILLARIVDPKLKYPIENIYDQKLSTSSKKLAAARKKKWQRLEKYFGGIANMTKLTKTQISRNVAIIIGQKEEMNAVRECQKLGIKMFSIVDTNCNPTFSDHIIPANDDSRSSIRYILTKFITRIRLAQKLRSRLMRYMTK